MAKHSKRSVREPDFLEEMIEESTRRNSDFPKLMAAAAERRRIGAQLAKRRQKLGLSQTKLAARMDTSQAQVSKVEAGAPDVRLSTLERYASAVGHEVHIKLRKIADAA